jgi:hypothetical protein
VVSDVRLAKGFIAIILIAAILLPLLGASLIVILALEQLVLRKIPRARNWLGLRLGTAALFYYLGTSKEYTSFQTRRKYIRVGSSKRSLFLTV